MAPVFAIMQTLMPLRAAVGAWPGGMVLRVMSDAMAARRAVGVASAMRREHACAAVFTWTQAAGVRSVKLVGSVTGATSTARRAARAAVTASVMLPGHVLV